jgi:glycosyltransferase involved in cell wall biosynthesis
MFQVSIVMAVKNEEKYILDALKSIISQKDVSFEIVLVDDNSDDRTFQIVKDFSLTNPLLKIFSSPGVGKVAAFNYGVEMSTGNYICLFAGDDLMPVGSLSARLNIMENNDSVLPVVVLSKLKTMSDDSKFDGHLIPKRSGVGALSGVSPLMNRHCLNLIFPIPSDLPNEDSWMDLAITYMDSIKKVHSNIICCMWRVHSGNSINFQANFDVYNSKISPRLAAIPKFHSATLSRHDISKRAELLARVACEDARLKGNIWGILISGAPVKEKLRSISIVNKFFYSIRKKLYGLLSGF